MNPFRRYGRGLAFLLSSVVLGGLTGCATLVDGTSQDIAFASTPPGATCSLTRADGWSASLITPASVTVRRTKYPIDIVCAKPGYMNAGARLSSDTNAWTFGNVIWGGIPGGGGRGSVSGSLLSSALGWGVDSATGADNKYDSSVTLVLQPAGVSSLR